DKLGMRGLQSPGIHFRDAQNGWFVSDDGLIMQTTDGGYTWTQRQSGIGAILADVTMYPDGRGVAVGESGALVVTDDFGGQWRVQPILRDPEGVAPDLARLAQTGGSRLFLAGKPGLVFRSDDRGDTWTTLENSPYFRNSIMHALDFVDEQIGYMFGRSYEYGLIYKTSDGGETWQTMMDLYDYEPLQLDAEMFDENNGVSVGSGSSFFFTTDGWQNYTHRPIVSAGVAWESIGFANLQVGWVGSFYGLVAHTTDGGLTWTDVYLPGVTNAHNIQAIDAKSENEVYILAAAPDETLVYQSFDGGQAWQVSAPGIQGPDFYPTPTYNFFVTDSGDIWTVGYLGFMLARRSAATAVGDGVVALPGAPRLHPAAPNPFNPATEIAFTLPAASPVRLNVHDLRGRRVASLIDGVQEAGTHRIRWDGRDDGGRSLPSGLFLARLVWDGGSESTKLMLVR
ncbi:MAG: YCF48-related protein, partial [Candidatus Krumholzibacteriia bacterium]